MVGSECGRRSSPVPWPVLWSPQCFKSRCRHQKHRQGRCRHQKHGQSRCRHQKQRQRRCRHQNIRRSRSRRLDRRQRTQQDYQQVRRCRVTRRGGDHEGPWDHAISSCFLSFCGDGLVCNSVQEQMQHLQHAKLYLYKLKLLGCLFLTVNGYDG
jgi:hypothetical protein